MTTAVSEISSSRVSIDRRLSTCQSKGRYAFITGAKAGKAEERYIALRPYLPWEAIDAGIA
jgi:hypothetical protein